MSSPPKSENSDHGTLESDRSVPSTYLHSEGSEKYNDFRDRAPVDSYTQCAVNSETGCWSCPECCIFGGDLRVLQHVVTLPDGSEAAYRTDHGLKSRGYEAGCNIVNNDAERDALPKCYNRVEDTWYFQNPAITAVCMNRWSDGFTGIPCGFNREEVEDRDTGLEEEYDVAAKEKTLVFDCLSCAHFDMMKTKLNPERLDYVLANIGEEHKSQIQHYKVNEDTPHSKYGGLFRRKWYDGTMESLQCDTYKWGMGNNPAGKDTPCPGVYGGPIVYWVEKESDDGKGTKWIEQDYYPAPDSDERIWVVLAALKDLQLSCSSSESSK